MKRRERSGKKGIVRGGLVLRETEEEMRLGEMGDSIRERSGGKRRITKDLQTEEREEKE